MNTSNNQKSMSALLHEALEIEKHRIAQKANLIAVMDNVAYGIEAQNMTFLKEMLPKLKQALKELQA